MKEFAERLKALRAENNLSQAQLANLTGLSKSAIAFWETDERIPNAQAVITLAKFFKVSTDYILGLTD